MNGGASISDLAGRMAAVVGARNCFSSGADLLTYECDGITHGRTRPDLVVLPGTTQEVVEVVRLARASGRPIVPRGSGTGLSGGARPVPGSVVVALSRMRRILDTWNEHIPHPHLPRDLKRRLQQAGFSALRVEIVPLLNVTYDPNTYSVGMMHVIGNFVSGRNGLSEQDVADWKADARKMGDADAYFFSLNRYVFIASK